MSEMKYKDITERIIGCPNISPPENHYQAPCGNLKEYTTIKSLYTIE